MRRRPSAVWTDLGYFDPAVNAQARQESVVPVRYEVSRALFARMHAVVDAAPAPKLTAAEHNVFPRGRW